MPDTIDLTVLAREIAARMTPEALLDAEDTAALLKCTARQVTERMVKLPGFPNAIRFAGEGTSRSRPRWRRADLIAYINLHADSTSGKGGRPRRSPEW